MSPVAVVLSHDILSHSLVGHSLVYFGVTHSGIHGRGLLNRKEKGDVFGDSRRGPVAQVRPQWRVVWRDGGLYLILLN